MRSDKILTILKEQLAALDKYDQDDRNRKAILETVWQSGKEAYRISHETGKDYKTLNEDVDAAPGTLQKHARFYRLYPDGYVAEFDGKPVAWSHYTAVLYVRNKEARDFYVQTAARAGWSSHELRRRIHNNYYENRRHPADTAAKGTAALTDKNQRLFTYAAKLLRVVDGDTLELEIDVGFNTWMRHKVRLRGIDCPETGTRKGDKATAFVDALLRPRAKLSGRKSRVSVPANEIKPSEEMIPVERAPDPSPLVVIRSYKSEKFGRYLVDLWYLPGETDREEILRSGKLLNQILLDAKLAEKVE